MSPLIRVTIIAEMRAKNSAAIAAHNDKMATKDWLAKEGEIMPSPLRERTTARLTESQQAAKTLLLKSFDDGMGNGWNVAKKAALVASRANGQLKYARPGHSAPDMLSALMAFFQNPGQLAYHKLLTATAPGNVPASLIKAVLADGFVVDVIEGLGHSIPSQKGLVGRLSHSTGKGRGNGRGRPRKVITSIEPVIVVQGGKGHSRSYHSDAMPTGRGVPGSAPTAHGVAYVTG